MNEEAIKNLITQAVAGDRESFGEIYELTKNYVYRTVWFLSEDKTEVDDIVQEVYIRIFKSLGSYDSGLPFRPWLTGITLKQVGEVRRKKWKLTRLVERLFSHGQSHEADVANTVMERELYHQVLRRVEKLTPKLKEVILLRYVHDFSQEEIAQITEIPLGTVKSRLNSALTKLRGDNSIQALGITKEQEGESHGF